MIENGGFCGMSEVVIVTGSSSGIGRAVAERFARDGARLIVNSSRSVEEGRWNFSADACAAGSKGNKRAANPSPEMPSPCEPEGPQGLGKKKHPTRVGVRQEAS